MSQANNHETLLGAAIAAYLRAQELEGPQDRQQWLERYPEVANGLAAFIDNDLQLRDFVAPPAEEGQNEQAVQGLAETEEFLATPRASTVRQHGIAGLDREPIQAGTVLAGQYRVRKDAHGGMGRVFFTEDLEAAKQGTKLEWALKTVADFSEWQRERLAKGRSAMRAEYESLLGRFRLEAQHWVELGKHENIIHAISVIEFGGMPYLLMEYADSGDLSSWIKARHLSLPMAVNFAIQFCRGMEYAYRAARLIHRDIKPQNVLVKEGCIIKISDLGLAKAFYMAEPHELAPNAGARSSRPMISGGVGTLAYMPPEQMWSFMEADARSDIFSFGAMLYEMVTYERLFPSQDSQHHMDLCQHDRTPAHQRNPRVPPSLSEIITRCTAFRPDDRYESFDAVAADLQRISDELPWQMPMPRSQDRIPDEFFRPGVRLLQETYSLISLGKYAEAAGRADQALALEPDNADHWINKGKALAELNKYQEALHCFSRATALRRNDARAWANCAFAANCLGRASEGLEFARGAVSADREFADAWFAQGTCEMDLGMHSAAVESLKRAAQLEPHNWKALTNLGVCLGELEHHEEAVETLKRVIGINPMEPKVYYHLAFSYAAMGRYQEAKDAIAVAIKIDDTSSNAWGLYGVIWWHGFEDREKAGRCFRRALAQDPGNLRVQRAWDSMNAEGFHRVF